MGSNFLRKDVQDIPGSGLWKMTYDLPTLVYTLHGIEHRTDLTLENITTSGSFYLAPTSRLKYAIQVWIDSEQNGLANRNILIENPSTRLQVVVGAALLR